MKDTHRSLLSLTGPSYWPIWLVFGFMRVTCFLPFAWQISLWKRLGRLAYRLAPARREIARRNLELCFPELSQEEVASLLKKHFESLGASIAEMSLAWWSAPRIRQNRITLSGAEHLDAGLAKGKGAILVCAHYTTFEMTVVALDTWKSRICGMYRPNANELLDELLIRGRENSVAYTIPKNNVRGMIRALRENMLVWYAADQNYRRKNSSMIKFFHELASTSTATSKIAEATGASVMLLSSRRLPDDSGYLVEVHPPLQDFPSEDHDTDTRRLNEMIEENIRKAPDQYYWIHRRFKERPAPLPDLYADL
jgi:KDO2-lipid IV(A) lauroyltransferase